MEASRNLESIQIILSQDIKFLETVAISIVNKYTEQNKGTQKKKKLRSGLVKINTEDISDGGNGVGVKTTNKDKNVCYELMMYGYSSPLGDPRTEFNNDTTADPFKIMKRFENFCKEKGFDKGSIFDEKISEDDGINVNGLNIGVCGYVGAKREGTTRPNAGPITGYYIEHFVIALPDACFIETTNDRDIMCTPPGSHMEEVRKSSDLKECFANGGKILSHKLPVELITAKQLLIIDRLVQEALRINDKYQLTGNVPLITSSYHWLRKRGLIDKLSSELNIHTAEKDKKIAKVFEKLLEIKGTILATETWILDEDFKISDEDADIETIKLIRDQLISQSIAKESDNEKDGKEKIDKEEQSAVKEEKEKKKADEEKEKLPESKSEKYADIKIRITKEHNSPVALEENVLERYIINAGRQLGLTKEQVMFLNEGDDFFEELIEKIKKLIEASQATFDKPSLGGNYKPPPDDDYDSSSSQPPTDSAKNSNGTRADITKTESNFGGSGTPPNQKESQSLEAQSLQLQNTVDTNIAIKKSDASESILDETKQKSQSFLVKKQAWMARSEVHLEKQVTEESQIESSLKI